MDKKSYRLSRLKLLALFVLFSSCNNIRQDELNGIYYERNLQEKYVLRINQNNIEQTIVTQKSSVDSLDNVILKDTIIVNKCNFFIDGNKLVFDGWYIEEKNMSPTLCVGCPLTYEDNTLVYYDNSNGGKKYVFVKVK